MGKQLQYGTQFPMRPAVALMDSEDAHTLVNDAPAVDWTAAASQIDLVSNAEAMDDLNEISIDATSKNAVLDPGQYHIRMYPVITDSAGGSARIAITNAAGSTVHNESDDITMAAGAGTQVYLEAYLHVTAEDTEVAFRAAATTGTASIGQNFPVCSITKIGNANQT